MSESSEQTAFFHWAALHAPRCDALHWLFHVPNGGKRARKTALSMQQQGVKRGVPDVLLPVRSGDLVGWACEFKLPGGRISPEQRAWLEQFAVQGWRAVVAFSWPEAARDLVIYLRHDPRRFAVPEVDRPRLVAFERQLFASPQNSASAW